ncbi:MAG: hypothetical protein WCS30_11800 [Selenomonadaceae bacterium]
MINFLQKILKFLDEFVLLIKKPSCIKSLNYGGVSVAFLVVVYTISDYLKIGILSKVIVSSMIVLLPITICLGIFDKYFKPFKHKAFINGMVIFASFITVLLLSWVKFADVFVPFCISTAIYATCWFSYHILTGRTSLKKIKIRLKFYLAVGSTLSFFLLLSTFNVNILKTVIASLVGSFAWVGYLLEEFENKE